MAEIGDKFPRRDLGPAEKWGRRVEEMVENLGRIVTGLQSSVEGANRGASSALSSAGGLIPRVTVIEEEAQETAQVAAEKSAVFYSPSEPSQADTGDLWFDTSDGNFAYVSVAEGFEADFEGGVIPFDLQYGTGTWTVVEDASPSGGPALVNTVSYKNGVNTSVEIDPSRRFSMQAWVRFTASSDSSSAAGLVFEDTGATDRYFIGLSLGGNPGSTGSEGLWAYSGGVLTPETYEAPFDVVADEWYLVSASFTPETVSVNVSDGLGSVVASLDFPARITLPGYAGLGTLSDGDPDASFSDFSVSYLGWEPAQDESIDAALQDAQDALNAASEAQTTADGKNSVYRDATVPTGGTYAQGDVWFELDGSDDVVAIHMWNGSAWLPYTMVADSILVPSSVGPISISDGAITAPKIAAGAIETEKLTVGTLDQFDPALPDYVEGAAGWTASLGDATASWVGSGTATYLEITYPQTGTNPNVTLVSTGTVDDFAFREKAFAYPFRISVTGPDATQDVVVVELAVYMDWYNSSNSLLESRWMGRISGDDFDINETAPVDFVFLPGTALPTADADYGRVRIEMEFTPRVGTTEDGVFNFTGFGFYFNEWGSFIGSRGSTALYTSARYVTASQFFANAADIDGNLGVDTVSATGVTSRSVLSVGTSSHPSGTLSQIFQVRPPSAENSQNALEIRLPYFSSSGTEPFLLFIPSLTTPTGNGYDTLGLEGVNLETPQVVSETVRASGNAPVANTSDVIQKTNYGPWATHTGGTSIPTVPSQSNVDVAITYPSGQFSVAPVPHPSTSHQRLMVGVVGRTVGGSTIRIWNDHPTSSISGATLYWTAVQGSSNNASGPN